MKQRRIIYNDDGGATKVDFNPAAADGPEGFLSCYFDTAIDTQVDSWFYNVGPGMTNADGSFRHWSKQHRKLPEAVGDDYEVIINAARKAGMEVCCSLRMNDVHEGNMELFDPLKINRPDLLMGGDHFPGKYPHLLPDEEPKWEGGYPFQCMLDQFWAGFDFAKREVRDHRLTYIREICSRYDWDGIELDFMRMTMLFRPGEERDNIETMNQFMRDVRAIVDEIADKRGRPYLIAARTPPTPTMALRTGMDLETWLRERIVELIIPGTENWFYTPRVKELIDLAHQYDVPALPSFGANLWNPARDPVVELHTITSNFHALGADGVAMFNFPYWDAKVREHNWLNTFGTPGALVGRDKCCIPDPGEYTGFWGHCNAPPALPVSLVHAPPIEVVVGDDVQNVPHRELRLIVKVDHLHEVERIHIVVNGEYVAQDAIEKTGDTFEAVLQAPLVKRGINHFEILPGPGCIGRLRSVVSDLQLWVRY